MMNKKYQIINLKSNEECTIFYILYIVLIFVIIFIIYKIISNFCFAEKFELASEKKLTPTYITNELEEKNNELNNLKNTLEERLAAQSKAIYISKNFNKVDTGSFNDELAFLLNNFANTKLPEINIDGKNIIQTQSELDSTLAKASVMKNFYKPGDIVTSDSTFQIEKNDICYRHNGKPINPDSTFMEQYPNCMVCSIEDPAILPNSNAWINTKTNINQVCLYNPTAETNSGIPNLEQCQKFCNISSNV